MSSAEQLDEMGPIDYVVLEWPGRQPSGEVAPLLVDLVDRGIIRILDIAFMVKDEDGTVAAIDLAAVADGGAPASPSSKAPPPASSATRTSKRRPRPSSPARRPPCSCGRTAGRRRSPSRSASRAASWSPAGALPVQAILASLEALEATN